MIIFAAAFMIATPGDAQPFTHPDALRAWERFKEQRTGAAERYQRTVDAAWQTYTRRVRLAAEVVARTGDTAELKALAEAQEKTPASLTAAPSGRWRIRYNNDTSAVYEFQNAGVIRKTMQNGEPFNYSKPLIEDVDGWISRTPHSVERITIIGDRLYSEKWLPAATYPTTEPRLFGCGRQLP